MMKSLLTQLERNEMLLMYLAGELPQEDMTQVERMLQADEALRSEMQQLRRVMQDVEQKLAEAPRVDDITAERAIGQTIAAMRRQREEDLVRHGSGRRMPGWAYPVAAAAILLMAVSVYLVMMDQGGVRTAKSPTGPADVPDLVAMLPVEPLADDAVTQSDVAEDLAATFDDSDVVLAEASERGGLVGAMEELRAIEQLSLEPRELD